jgi:hypothetical protein
MNDPSQIEQLSETARRTWKRLASEFPLWTEHLDACGSELEFAVPAPSGSKTDHLIAFTNGEDLWVRFSPSYMCYYADDDDELVSLIRKLTTDEIVFKVTMVGDAWAETTLATPNEECESLPGRSVRFVSWSGKFDKQA